MFGVGAGFTWSLNSHENRITTWSNDAVSDPPSEAIYIRDEDSGATWTPTPLPIREAQGYLIRHGQGYSVFEHASHGISQELLLFSPLDAPVRISLLRLLNRSDRRRKLSVTSYQELVLGVTREASANHIVTDLEENEGAIFARNSYNNEFSNRVAFVGTSEQRFTMTCDRKEFIGRNGTLARPVTTLCIECKEEAEKEEQAQAGPSDRPDASPRASGQATIRSTRTVTGTRSP